MTDEELIARLKSCSSDEAMWSREAATRIKALLKEQVLLRTKLDAAAAGLETIIVCSTCGPSRAVSLAALNKIKEARK